MAFILASLLKTHYYDDFGNRIAIPLEDENGILKTVTELLPRADGLAVVANDKNDFQDNDAKLNTVVQSFEMTGIRFARATVLDARNQRLAAEIVDHADLILLSGGKCFRQKRFFDEIGLKGLLTRHAGLTVGVSAGAMNLCETVANFPEEESDLNDPLWFDGMGFFDRTVIPHFDGERGEYQLSIGNFDVAKDYILPMSHKHDFLGLPNGSFIAIRNDGKVSLHGDIYKISNGAVTKTE